MSMYFLIYNIFKRRFKLFCQHVADNHKRDSIPMVAGLKDGEAYRNCYTDCNN